MIWGLKGKKERESFRIEIIFQNRIDISRLRTQKNINDHSWKDGGMGVDIHWGGEMTSIRMGTASTASTERSASSALAGLHAVFLMANQPDA